jgi:signal transduction histidine kinase
LSYEISIRRTLLIRCGIGIAALLAALSLATYLTVRHRLYEELDQSLRETASILANQIEFEDGKIIFEWQEGIGTNPAVSDSSLFQYWDEKHGTTTRSPALGEDELPKFTGPAGAPDIETITIPGRIARARAIGLTAYPYVIPEEKAAMRQRGETFDPASRPHTLVIARDAAPVLRTLALLAVILTIGSLVTPVLGFLVIDGAIRSSLRPIHALTESVRNRSETEIDTPIYIPGGIPAELSPLAASFEALLSRVANIRHRERDFIRHASHELRTPIAGLSAVTELALSRPRTPEEYVRHLKSCAESSARLGDLIQRLSALSRIGSQSESPKLVPLDLAEILTASLDAFEKRYHDCEIGLSVSYPKETFTSIADPVLTALIINNLADNAASYTPSGSTVSIQLVRSKGRDEISFTNPCEDLPENLERLFEPLFRRDPSRTGNDHLGIGLTLSREAAEAMRATLSVDRPDRETIRFTLSIPI